MKARLMELIFEYLRMFLFDKFECRLIYKIEKLYISIKQTDNQETKVYLALPPIFDSLKLFYITVSIVVYLGWGIDINQAQL